MRSPEKRAGKQGGMDVEGERKAKWGGGRCRSRHLFCFVAIFTVFAIFFAIFTIFIAFFQKKFQFFFESEDFLFLGIFFPFL